MSAKIQRDYQFASSLEHGIALLRCFDEAHPYLGNAEFVRGTGLSRSTVSRLTYTLSLLGFLRQDATTRKYRLGAAAVAVGYPFLLSLRIRQQARPVMQTLARQARAAVFLAMRDRHRMVLIESCRFDPRAARRMDIGASLSIMNSAVGLAWLCSVSRLDREDVLRSVKRADAGELERCRDTLRSERVRWTRHGYCASDELVEEGFASVATALPGSAERIVIGCAASVLPDRIDGLGQQLRASAALLADD